MSTDDPTLPDASTAPLPKEPSPFLAALTRAYLLAKRGSHYDVDLERLLADACEDEGLRVAEVLSLPEFRDLEPEGG